MSRDKLTQNLTNAILFSCLASYNLEELKHTKLYLKGVKMHTNKLIKALAPMEGLMDKFFENDEQDITHNVTKLIEDTAMVLNKIPIHEFNHVHNILNAYIKDSESIKGIAKKILRNEEVKSYE